jgi:hypothetical protein
MRVEIGRVNKPLEWSTTLDWKYYIKKRLDIQNKLILLLKSFW